MKTKNTRRPLDLSTHGPSPIASPLGITATQLDIQGSGREARGKDLFKSINQLTDHQVSFTQVKRHISVWVAAPHIQMLKPSNGIYNSQYTICYSSH
jgi:hypothetical protein